MELTPEVTLAAYVDVLRTTGYVSCSRVAAHLDSLGYVSSWGNPISRQLVYKHMARSRVGRYLLSNYPKGRRWSGGRSKLTDAEREAIVRMAIDPQRKMTFRQIGAQFGVTDAHVSYLLKQHARV